MSVKTGFVINGEVRSCNKYETKNGKEYTVTQLIVDMGKREQLIDVQSYDVDRYDKGKVVSIPVRCVAYVSNYNQPGIKFIKIGGGNGDAGRRSANL